MSVSIMTDASRQQNTLVSELANLFKAVDDEQLQELVGEIRRAYDRVPLELIKQVFAANETAPAAIKRSILEALFPTGNLEGIASKEDLVKKHPELRELLDSNLKSYLPEKLTRIIDRKIPQRDHRRELLDAEEKGRKELLGEEDRERARILASRPRSRHQLVQDTLAPRQATPGTQTSASQLLANTYAPPARAAPTQAVRTAAAPIAPPGATGNGNALAAGATSRRPRQASHSTATQRATGDFNADRAATASSPVVQRALRELEDAQALPSTPYNDVKLKRAWNNYFSAISNEAIELERRRENEAEPSRPPLTREALSTATTRRERSQEVGAAAPDEEPPRLPLTREALAAMGDGSYASTVDPSIMGGVTPSEVLNQEIAQKAIKEPEAYIQERQKEIQAAHDLREAEAFDFGNLPRAIEGEHYSATFNRWASEKALEILKQKYKTDSPIEADDPLVHIAEEALNKELEKGTHRNPEELQMQKFYNTLIKRYNTGARTKSQQLLDLAAEDITPEEIERYKNPHTEGLLDTMFNRAKKRFDSEKKKRYQAHQDQMASRFYGNVYNSSSRARFDRDFEEREREIARDFEEDMQRHEQELLYKGDIEAWARARGKREALERNAQMNEGISQNRFRNVAESHQNSVNNARTHSNRAMELQLARIQLGKARQAQRQQERNMRNQHQADVQNRPMNQLGLFHAMVNGHPANFHQETTPPAYVGPAPDMSGYARLGGTMLSLNAAQQQQQANAAQNQYLRLQNENMARNLSNVQGVGIPGAGMMGTGARAAGGVR